MPPFSAAGTGPGPEGSPRHEQTIVGQWPVSLVRLLPEETRRETARKTMATWGRPGIPQMKKDHRKRRKQ